MKKAARVILMSVLLSIFASSASAYERWFSRLEWQKITTGYGQTEGPAVDNQGTLYFTDMNNNRIYSIDLKGSVSVVRENSASTNGLALDKHGRLLMCEQFGPRITRLEKTASGFGTITVLAETRPDRALVCPNDICALRDGSFYFSDPTWLDPPDKKGSVYRIAPDGKVTKVLGNINIPNGLEASRDGKKLYLSVTGDDHVDVYDINEDGSLKNGRLFAESPDPDGIAVDSGGRVYVAQWGGAQIHIFDSQGNAIGLIKIPERRTANCAFDPNNDKILYVTAGHSVYKILFL